MKIDISYPMRRKHEKGRRINSTGQVEHPRLKTLEPGVPDSDLYTEESGSKDEDQTWWDGRNVGGVTIGLAQFRANLPIMPGNMGIATTFDFPMLYREINSGCVRRRFTGHISADRAPRLQKYG